MLKKSFVWLLVMCLALIVVPFAAFASETTDASVTSDTEIVAKVGNTEYATIDEAIANWTNGTTLTLLSDVTLSDVITLKSTEKHVLDLGTYTMTAASKKDAIQIENCGRTNASYALDITADSENPGGITATGNAIVRTTGKSGVKDRPIIRFYNGVFNACYIEYHSGSNGNNCPQFQFHDGEFNGTIYTNRALNQFYGGVFTGSLMMSVDSSAYTLVAGGSFKQLSNLYMSSLNSDKFTIGSAKGVYDKEVYVDDNGNFVIAATEPSEGVEADVAKTPGTNDYFKYSKVSVEGQLAYTSAEMALAKNTSATITVYVDELDMTGINFTGTIVVPEGKTLTIKNAPAGLKVEGSCTIVEPPVKVEGVDVVVTDKGNGVYDIALKGGASLPEEGVKMTFSATGDESNMAYVVHEHKGSYYVYVGEVVDGKLAFNNTVGFSTFTVYEGGLNEALAAAATMTGDVTIEIYDKVTLNQSLSGSYDSITFVGKTASAEIYLDVQGYITASGKTVFFEDLTLSKSAGGFVDNAGFMNLAFGVYDVEAVSYNKCIFANGAYASSGDVTYTGCTFYRSHDKYGMWAYGDVDIVVDGCAFDDYRGIKMYAEGGAKTVNLTVKNTDFSMVTDKPAIVLTFGESVTLEGNTYSSTGVFELDLDGAPNGTLVTSDVAPTCKNDNGACGVLVDGKIYTTVAQAAAVATSGSKVTLLHDSTETVEFVMGVTLDKNGYTADGVTVQLPVASVNGVEYTDLQEAIIAAAPNGTVEILSDVTVDKWIMFAEKMTIGNGNLITLNINGLTINGNDHTLTVKSIESAGNGNRLFYDAENLNINNLTIKYIDSAANQGGIGLQSGTLDGVNFVGGGYGVLPGAGEITITNCNFQTNSTAIYFEEDRDNLVVDHNTFELGDNVNAILLRGSVKFTGNTIASGRTVNVVSGSPVVTGNNFGDVRFKVYNTATATITENTINNLEFSDATVAKSTFTENTMSAEAEAALAGVQPVAIVNGVEYTSVQAAINAAQKDDIVTIYAGEYAPINISNKNITIQGTVGANGELLTTIKGGDPAITGHGFNGTIKNLKIVDAWKVMYAEPAGNVTADNLYVTGATYGLHLVAYSEGLTWTIQNSYMDLRWANSFGVAGGDAAIIITGNIFETTNPFYPDYGAIHVNSFLPNVTVTENVFGENAKIYIDGAVTDTSKLNIYGNYHADGVDKAFADDAEGITVTIPSYYAELNADGTINKDSLVELPRGNNFNGYTGADGIWGEVWGNAKESFVIKVLDANGNVMGSTSLNNIDGIIDGDVTVTWNLKLDAASNTDEYWEMEWITAPSIDTMPAKVELWVDGVCVSGGDVVLNAPDDLNKIYAAVADADGIIEGYYTSLAQAAEVATSGSSVVLLRDTTEVVKLALGVTLVENGFAADGVTMATAVAQIGDVKFETVADAVEYAKNEGITDLVITLLGTNTKESAIALDDSFYLYNIKVFDSVTFKQEDNSVPYYIAGISTGSRTNDGEFVFDGVNIHVLDQYIFEGNVRLINNSVITSSAEANCFIFNGTTTIEPGSKIKGVIEDFRGGDLIVDGGRIDGAFNETPDFQDAILIVNWAGDSLVIKNGAYVKINSVNEIGRLTINSGASVDVSDSKLDAWEHITVTGTLNTDVNSLITTGKITGAGVINIDATYLVIGETVQVIKANMSDFTGTINVFGKVGAQYEITDDGLVIYFGLDLKGEGTAEAPYQIGTLDELINLREMVAAGNTYAGKYFKLTANIDLSAASVALLSARNLTANWEPIGTKDAPFMGIFDGDNKVISNLIIVGGANQGFFGYADKATIKNVILENVTVIGTDCVGGIAGQVYSVSLIDNCHVRGTIQIEGQTNVGGIVGKYYTKVTNCSVIGDGVTTSYIKGVYVAADLEGDNIGGIMGHCGENNNLSGNTVKNITISGTRKVGGIVGIADQNTDIQNCVVENVVIETTATEEYANDNVKTMSIGGLIGQYQAAGSKNDGTVIGNTIKNVAFNNVNDVTVAIGTVVGGARGGSDSVLPPSADIESTNNAIDFSTITGSNNDYLLTIVAQIGDVKYQTLSEALAAAQPGDEIVILASTINFAENAASIVIDKAITIKGLGADKTTLNFNSATSAFVIASSDVTFADMTIVQGAKDNSFHISISKGAWDAPKNQYKKIEIKNINFVGGDNALCLIGENIVVDGCTFDGQDSHNIIVYSSKGDSKIINNVFNASKGSNKSAILYEGGADNAKDLSGFIGGGTLTLSGNEANAKGVFFQFTNWGLIENMNLVITDNKIDGITNKAIAIYDMDGAVKAKGNEFADIIVRGNSFTNTAAGKSIIKEYTGEFAVEVTENYFGSETPDLAALVLGEKVLVKNYYSDAAMTNLVDLAVAKIGSTSYYSFEEALAAAQPGETIELLDDITASEVIMIGKSITINGNGHKITSTATRVIRVDASDVEVTLNDVNMVSNAVRVGTNDIRGISIDASLANVKLTLNNCSVDFTDASANDWTYAVNVSGSGNGHVLTVQGGSYEGANVINVHGANNTVTVKDATLTSLYPNHDIYCGTGIWVLQENGSTVVAEGNTFNGGNAVNFNVGTGTELTESNNVNNMTRVVAKIGNTYYVSLEDAFKAATEGCVIEILSDVTIDGKWDCRDYATNGSHSQFKESVTINGNGHTLKFTGTISDSNWNTIFRFEENATVKNLTVDISEATGAQRVITAKKSLTVDNLTIIGSAKYGIIFGEGASAEDLAAAEIVITNSNLTGTRRAISDNEGGKDVKSVTITGNTLHANVYVSAAESVIFNGNTVDDGYVNIRSYASSDTLSVTAQGNTLMANTVAGYNIISNANTVDAQNDFLKAAPVATINGIPYASLADAYKAAQDGDVIELVANAALDETLTVAKSITINGNGNIITTSDAFVGNASNAMIDLQKSITLDNVVFDGVKGVAVMRAVSADVVMDNCVVQNCQHTASQGLLRLACGNATITNSKFLNNNCTMVLSFGYDAANDTDVLTIDNCVFEGNNCGETAVVYFADGGDAAVTNTSFIGNTVTSSGNAATLYMGWGEGYEVIGCTFEGNTVITSLATTKRFASAIFCDGCTVSGNVFSGNTAIRNGETVSTVVAAAAYYGAADISGNFWGGNAPVPGVDYTVEYDRNEVAVEDYYTDAELTNKVVIDYVAKVGKYSYTTLADAVAAAQPGETITLLTDVKLTGKLTIAKAITIDGNGHSIIADETAVWYTVSGKLNIKNYNIHLIGVNSDGVTLKDIVLDNNNNAAGINIYCAQNVVFDNVSIINATKGFAALTVNGSTLTVKTAFSALGNGIAIDTSNGSGVTSALGFTVEDGTVFDLGGKTVKFASVAAMDMTGAVDANGAPYFAAMDNAYFYTQAQMESRTTAYSNGLTLLTDVTLEKDIEVKGTLDLNGNDLKINELKTSGNLTITGEGTIKATFVLTSATATLTGPEGLNVTTTVAESRVVYEDGVYKVVAIVYVAQIGDVKYESFEEALNAVRDGETIVLQNVEGSELGKEIEFTKDITFTIKGKAPNYALPVITFQNATVNIENAEILIPELDARQNATINVINSTVRDAGGDGIVKSYFNGAIHISGESVVHTMQVTTMGIITVSDSAALHATWQTNVYGNGMIVVENNATFNTAALHLTGQDYSGRDNTDADRVGKPATIVVDGATFTVGKVYSDNGADYSYNSSKGINIGTVAGKNAVLDVKNGATVNIFMANGETANIGAGGLVNVDGSAFNVACRGEGSVKLANNGVISVSGASAISASVTGAGWVYMHGVTLDANTNLVGAKVRFASGTNYINGSTITGGFFQVGIGAYNGVDANVDTVNGVIVNVENAHISANGESYAGWIGTGFYDTDAEKAAVMTDAKYVLNIKNSIAEFGYLHISNDGELNVIGNAAEKKWYNNSDYSFYAGDFIINGVANFEATDVLALYTKVSCDNGTAVPGTLNINAGTEYEAERHNGAIGGTNFLLYKTAVVNVAEGGKLHIGEYTTIAADAVMNIAGNVTALGTITNNGKIVLTALNATLTTPETTGVATEIEGYRAVYADGAYILAEIIYEAQIGDVKYEFLADALAEVQEGETIKLLTNITGDVDVPANIKFNGNSFAIDGTLTAMGDLTFVGATKAVHFGIFYAGTTINIDADASLVLTGTGRIVLGHGCTFNIVGNITDAKTTDKTAINPSFVIPGGASITGNGLNFNVTNAYIQLGNTSSKNSAATGAHQLTFTNSIVEFTNQFTLSEPTGGLTPEFNVTIENSVVTAVAKICIAAPNSTVVIDNSDVTTSNNFRNSGNVTLKNGASLTAGMIQFGENGGNNGTITVDASTFKITNSNKACAMDGQGIGILVLQNNAVATIDYITNSEIKIDATSILTVKEILGTSSITITQKSYKGADVIVIKSADTDFEALTITSAGAWYNITEEGLAVSANPVVQINDDYYFTLEDALANAQLGDILKLVDNVVYEDIVMLKGVALDLNGYTLEAEGLVAFKNANVLDNGATKGLLKVADKDLFTLSGGAYPMLPVWNEEDTGYVFVSVNPQSQLQVKADDKFTVIYRPSINGGGVTNEAMFADGALDNDLIFKINVLCMKNGEVAETLGFALSEELVKEVYGNNKAFYLNIFGATNMFDEYKIEFVIESTSGISFTTMMTDSFIPTTVSE